MDIGIGRLVKDGVRDAVHIAVIPVVCGDAFLDPGEKVTLRLNGKAYGAGNGKGAGVVDPFLPERIKEGDRFYLFLYPGSITSLRHHWTHPDIPEERMKGELDEDRERAKANLNHFAVSVGLSLDELLRGAGSYLKYGEYLIDGGRYEGVYMPDTFWQDYQVYTGIAVNEDKQGHFFSCSC